MQYEKLLVVVLNLRQNPFKTLLLLVFVSLSVRMEGHILIRKYPSLIQASCFLNANDHVSIEGRAE